VQLQFEDDGNDSRLSQELLYKFLNDKFVHEVKQLDDKIAKADQWETV
jgi:type I restriction enzyme M protein